MAEEIRQRRVSTVNTQSISLVEFQPLGTQWAQCFLARHSELQTVVGCSIEATRIKNTTSERLQH